jgi:hypothetical protein
VDLDRGLLGFPRDHDRAPELGAPVRVGAEEHPALQAHIRESFLLADPHRLMKLAVTFLEVSVGLVHRPERSQARGEETAVADLLGDDARVLGAPPRFVGELRAKGEEVGT